MSIILLNTIKMPVKHKKKHREESKVGKKAGTSRVKLVLRTEHTKPPLSPGAPMQALRLLCLRLHGRRQCLAGQSPGSTQVKCPTERLYFRADISQLLEGKLPDREKEE